MPPYHVEIQVEFPPPLGAEDYLRRAVLVTLGREKPPADSEVTLLLTGDARIRDLNRQFMDEDKVTDVLSFPAGDPTPGVECYLGDIAISVPRAIYQAEQAQISAIAELQLLAVHATLHLLGYDHLEPGDKQRMWHLQNLILADLGIEEAAPA